MRVAVCVIAAAAALAACGGDSPEQSSAPATPQPAPSAAAETATATASPTASATPTPTTQPLPSVSPEDQPGGAGDEEPVRVPARFTVTAGGVDPPAVAVPAFLTIELTVRNESGAPVVVRLTGAEPLSVAPGETGRAVIEGRKKGRYPIDFGDGRSALLISGAQPGP